MKVTSVDGGRTCVKCASDVDACTLGAAPAPLR